MTVDRLKQMFIEKYGDVLFLTKYIVILVTLTKDQYTELNNDLIKISGRGTLIMIDETDITFKDPEEISYTKIVMSINKIKCEFFVVLGNKFEFRMADKENEHGEGEL